MDVEKIATAEMIPGSKKAQVATAELDNAREQNLNADLPTTPGPCAAEEAWITFLAVILGTINNLGYCVVLGSAQPLAKSLGYENDIAFFATVMNAACLSGTMLNASCCLTVSRYRRILTINFLIASGYLLLVAACLVGGFGGFVLALSASGIVGFQQSLGEVTNLAFLKVFPPGALGGWGAVTGIAGICGSSVYLWLRGLGLTRETTYALFIPMILIYWGAFHVLHRLQRRFRNLELLSQQLISGSEISQHSSSTIVVASENFSWPRLKRVVCNGYSIFVCMVTVYSCEYFIYPGLVDRATLCPVDQSYVSMHAYTLMWGCYNVGVTMSRYSVALFRIDRLWLLTVLQLVNLIVWVVEVELHFMKTIFGSVSFYVMAVWMVFVGCMGGACYANCMYAFNHRPGIPDEVRELGINVGFLMSNVGILLATFLSGALDQGVFSKDTLYPNGCPPYK